MARLKLFISYSTTNKHLAGQLKRHFEEFGQEVFIAHDDIEPGSQWEAEILKNLATSDIFMPLETDELQTSYWCQQEIGMAVERGIIIVPLLPDSGGAKPKGFHAKFQGFPIRTEDVRESARRLLIEQGIIEDNSDTVEEKRLLVFEKSDSWAEAAQNAERLLELEAQFSDAQKVRVAQITLSNGQIRNSWDAQRVLGQFFKRHSDIIPADLLRELLSEGF